MTAIAIIPARGGSRGLHRKNLLTVGGRSLVRRAVETYSIVPTIGVVVVTTDDGEIAAEAAAAGAMVVDRPAPLAGDLASSESAVLHALVAADPSNRAGIVVFGQCTSPFVDPATVARAIRRVAEQAHDVVFAAVPSHGFLWGPKVNSTDSTVGGVNHDPASRPRRQDRPPEFLETGAFYVMRRDGFEATHHRFFGRIGVEPVDRHTAVEIDDRHDLDLARSIAQSRGEQADSAVTPVVGRIHALVTDFDGVHTDNRVWVDETGRESVAVNRGDGLGLARLRAAGVDVLILSTERNPVVARRAEKLGVDCRSGCHDKWSALDQWLNERGHRADHTMYLGNDINDAECLARVGWPVVVSDAHASVRALAVFRTTAPGGHGAVREVIDVILGTHQPSTRPPRVRRLVDAVTA